MKDKSVGIIPVYKSNKEFLFLIIHQVVGHWGFPKGHPNFGESETETALREFREETGIDKCKILEDFKYAQNYSFEKDGVIVEKEVIFFIGLIDKESTLLDKSEVQASKWLSYRQSVEQLTYKESRDMLKLALEFLEKKVSLS